MPQAQVAKNKTVTLSGKIYRSDTNQPLPGATIELWKDQGKGLKAKTDDKGNYLFEQVSAGKYKVAISLRYSKETNSPPCKLGIGITADKDSYVNTKDDDLKYYDQYIAIYPYRIYSGKPLTKDFDVACIGSYRNGPKR